MANKFVFNKTREDNEKEEAKKQRELEAEVQNRNTIRSKKLEQLNKKTKQNKMIVIISMIVISSALLIFGTYNTFFKQPLTQQEVVQLIKQSDVKFNDGGIEGFLYNNIEEIFKDNTGVDSIKGGVEVYKLDLNSLRIDNIQSLNANTAYVEFYINVYSKGYDREEKDRYTGELKVVKGTELEIPYRFSALIGNNKGTYYFASDVEILGYVSAEDSKITKSTYLSFEDKQKVSDDVANSAKTKVDRIMADLYAHKDVGGDYEPSAKDFDYNLEYRGINEFKMYQETNALGYNVVMTYTVASINGFTYTTKTYLKVEQAGNSWKITKIL